MHRLVMGIAVVLLAVTLALRLSQPSALPAERPDAYWTIEYQGVGLGCRAPINFTYWGDGPPWEGPIAFNLHFREVTAEAEREHARAINPHWTFRTRAGTFRN